MRKKTNFIKLIQVWGILFLVGLGASIVAVDVIGTYREFNAQADQMRTDFIANQKQIIKQEVAHVVEMIRFERSQRENLTREKIKSRVYEAYAIALHIYQQNQGSRSKADIQQMILDALRPIRFENGKGYYFATRLDGVEILFADRPQMEGLNLLDMQDTRGQYVIKDMLEIIKQSGEGMYEYHWTQPGITGNDFKKISFIKRVEPFDWFIGTGLYVDDVEDQIKADLLSAISRIRFGKEGYIFINKLNGDALVSNGKLFSGTKKLWEVFNDNPEKMKDIFKKEYQAALKPAGDFIHYSWSRLTDSDKESPKASFIYGIPEMQWLVGAGVYLDDVETNISVMQAKLNNQIKQKLLHYILIIFAIFSAFFLFYFWLNKKIKKDFNLIISFFKGVVHSDKEIDRDNIQFNELDQMAAYANKMLMDRKQAEASEKESGKKYKNILGSIEDGYYEVDLTGKFIFFNNAMCRILGYSGSEMMGMNYRLFMNQENVQKVFQTFNSVFASGKPVKAFDWMLINKKGSHRYIDTSVSLIKDADGKVTGFRGVVRDITDRRMAEDELRESRDREKFWADVVRMANIGIAVGYPDGRLGVNNAAFQKMIGYSEEELKQIDWNKVLTPPEWIDAETAKIKELHQTKKTVIYEKEYIRKDGTRIPIELTVNPGMDKEGTIDCYYTFVTDITDRKCAEKERHKLEKDLRQSQKMESIGTLAGGIAHDFNNILSSVIGFTELALDDVEKGTQLEDSLQEVFKAGKRARDLVKQILTFARRTDAELKPIQVGSIVKDALKLIRASIPVTIDIQQHIESDSVIMGNSGQMHQLFINLCTNAAQAMDDTGGILKVDLKDVEIDMSFSMRTVDLAPGSYLLSTVTDSGPGITPDIIDSIFEPFFTTKGVGEGTGMGLAMVHGIVEDHGGKIFVDSQPGKGSVFSVYLPITKKRGSSLRKKKGAIPSGTERILFVDDELPIAKMGSRILERLGYQVTVRTSSIEAVELFRAKPGDFDLVISDVTMPNMTGDKLAVELMKIRPDIPVILCTGYSKKISDETAAHIGIKAFAFKPIVKADLAKTVRDVLDGKE